MSGNNFGRDDGILPQSDSDSESGELPADPNDLQEDAQVGDDDSLSAGGSPPSDSGTPPASQPSGAKTAWAEELPRTSSALAVGSYQNFSQFLAALRVIVNPGKTSGDLNTTPRGPPSALSSAQAASDRVAAFTNWATVQAGPSHIGRGASTTPEVLKTEGGQVLASPETPDASPALAVGSYQKFSQFLAALEADIYPGNTSGGPNTTPRGPPSALSSAQAASDHVAASTSRATQQAGPSHIGCARASVSDRPSASRGGQAEDSRLQQLFLEMRALLKKLMWYDLTIDAIADILRQLDL